MGEDESWQACGESELAEVEDDCAGALLECTEGLELLEFGLLTKV